ncbi:MAG TPA: ATP-binding protein [Candidatus Saccharimonadales bacterium]|nr:ATP-binding protein [Candidatus Saccharimonadales bacterium]
MLRRFYNTFIRPTSKDPDAYSRELVLNWLLLGITSLTAITFFLSFFALVFLHQGYTLTRFIFVVVLLIFWVGLFGLSKFKQKHTLAEIVLVGLFFCLASFMAYRWGIRLPLAGVFFSLVIIMAGILLGARYSLYTALAVSILVIGFEYAKGQNWYQPDLAWIKEPSVVADALINSALYGVIALISWLFNRQMELSLKRAQRSEKALKRQRDLLEVKVEERTRELQSEQLEKVQQFYRFAELGRLSTALFHDLANHLMSVSVDIEGLKSRRQADILERIQDNIHYIDTVVQRVHQQMQGKRKVERFDVFEEVEEIIKIMALNTKRLGIAIELQAPSSKKPLFYTGDVTRFRQLVSNLISNGVDAYQDVSQQNKLVAVSIERTKESLTVRVADQGIGISPNVQAKIFEPFYTTKEKGIGIGLFIVKQIVEEDFKGTITLLSNKNQGTSFTVTLPLKAHAKKTRT